MKFKVLFLFFIFISINVSAKQPYTIERSNVVEIYSITLKKHYDLSIQLPRGYSKNKRYPVLYLTDSGYSFPLVSSLLKQMSGAGKVSEVIIVGISYSKEERWDISRTRDYTPTNSPNEQIGFSKQAKMASGEADKFTTFIYSEVFEYIDKNYRSEPSNRIFIGHSFGGLLGAYIIKTKPNTFNTYILSDPSLWYDNEVLFSIDNEGAKNVKVNVLIVSSSPDNPPKRGGFPHNMVQNAKKLERQLINYLAPSSDIKAKIYDGQLHETIYPIAVSQGLLRFVKNR